jgi:hypothetical protein
MHACANAAIRTACKQAHERTGMKVPEWQSRSWPPGGIVPAIPRPAAGKRLELAARASSYGSSQRHLQGQQGRVSRWGMDG